MVMSAKSYIKKNKNKNKTKIRQTEPQDKWLKQSYTDKITQRRIHIHTHKKRKRKKKNLYLKKKQEEIGRAHV